MNILLINKFLYPKGGDAISTLATGKLLEEKGQKVFYWGMKHPDNPEYLFEEYFVCYVDYDGRAGLRKKIKNALNILYSFEARDKIEKLLSKIHPDVVHLNNFAHQISPSILSVFRKYDIPVVMTMHDYKLVCPAYNLMSKGQVCEKCKSGKYYWCLLNKCTHESQAKSLVNMVEMYLHHKVLHIYDKIGIYISPSKFLMNKVKEMGFKHRVVYLPNFVDIDSFRPSYGGKDKNVVYIGRLSCEKGLKTLLNAVKGLDAILKVIGDGPIKPELEEKVVAEKINNVVFLGYKSGEELHGAIKNAIVTVMPSEWYENNPRTIIESFALGKPVIGARMGGIPELVKDGQTGYTFEAGNAEDLRSKIKLLIEDPNGVNRMGRVARKLVERKYNPGTHYEELLKIYRMAAKNRGA
jgi:glycosyltransferase involved in cell wall biosynthesis